MVRVRGDPTLPVVDGPNTRSEHADLLCRAAARQAFGDYEFFLEPLPGVTASRA